MTILSDREIKHRLQDMITPFIDHSVREIDGEKVISYGLTSFGYDVRCSNEFQVFSNIEKTIIDPKNFNKDILMKHTGDCCVIPPNSFALSKTIEYFRIPANIKGIVLPKSSYARCGITCAATPLQPGWEGNLVLEISNHTPLPVIIYANEGIAEVTFFKGEYQCENPYTGNYQGQTDIKTCDV